MRHRIVWSCVGVLMVAGLLSGPLLAALTVEQKKELKTITVDAAKITPLIVKKNFVDAEAAIKEVEERVSTFASEAGLQPNDPTLKPVKGQIEKVKTLLKNAMEKGVSFEKSVAVILAGKCVECHSEEPKGGLRLGTFEGLEAGGNNGPLFIPGNAEGSLIIQRLLVENEALRMPQGRDPLSPVEVEAIATWIAEGARFEGDKTATMVTLAKSAANSKAAGGAVKNNKPIKNSKKVDSKETGNETVHFTQDVMPELVDTCGRCHNDTMKRSGFSVMSFEKLMKGGSSGAVIVPGSLEKSRLWRLVNGDETPVMPAGNGNGITRKWHAKLKTWIEEGAKFDGSDPQKNFPSAQDREAATLAKYSPEQWQERREKAATEAWKKTFPKVEPHRRETAEFLIYSDVPEERIEKLEKWASEQVEVLRQTFKAKDEPLWKGKLAVFVFQERFGYEEFNSSVQKRETPREMIGHSEVSPTMEQAYVALQDVGDTESETSPGMRVNLIDHLTGAFLRRSGKAPDWLVRGTGLALAHQKSPANPYLNAMPRQASRVLQETSLPDPAALFVEGTFSPADIDPIACSLVEFLLKRGNSSQFGQFVQRVQLGGTVEAAIKAVYRTDGKSLAAAYAASLPNAAKKGKK